MLYVIMLELNVGIIVLYYKKEKNNFFFLILIVCFLYWMNKVFDDLLIFYGKIKGFFLF